MRTGSPSTGEGDAGAGRLPEPELAAIDRHLRQRELRRDELHQRARRLRRDAQGAMGRLHEGTATGEELDKIRREAAELTEWLRTEGRGEEGLAHDALQESAEALLLEALVRGRPLPGPAELGIDPEPYLMGLGDTAGEIRRLALDRLGAGDVAGAEARLATLDHLVRTLMRFDTTRAIVALKPKQDVARSLLERTRGDVTMAKLLQGRAGAERSS
jgi:translin